MTIPAYDPKKKQQFATPTPMPGYKPPTAQQSAYATSLQKEAVNMPQGQQPMPDWMKAEHDKLVAKNGGQPLPTGVEAMKQWANTPVAQPNMPPTAMSGISTNVPNMPQQSGFSLDKSALQAEAAARIAKLRAGVEGAVTSGKASRKNLYDYTNTITQGNRSLENFDNSQRGDIYGGSAREDKFRLERVRGIDDTFTNNAYTNDINALDAQLTSFDTLAPEQQQTLYNDLLRQEREYGLQEGALTGQFNGQQTLAAQGQSFNQGMQQQEFNYNTSPTNPSNVGQNLQNQLSQLKLDDYPAESKAAAQKTQDELKANKITLEEAEYKLKELKNPDSFMNRKAKAEAAAAEIELKYLEPEMKAKAREITARINKLNEKPETDPNKQRLKEIELEKAELQLNGLKKDGTTREAQGTIAADLAEASSEADVNSYFSTNGSHFIPIIGAEAWNQMKKDALSQFSAENKSQQTIRAKAIKDAQNDVRWLDKKTDRSKLIAEYESYYK